MNMKKFTVTTLGELQAGDRFYFHGDKQKRVYKKAFTPHKGNKVAVISLGWPVDRKLDEQVIFLRHNE